MRQSILDLPAVYSVQYSSTHNDWSLFIDNEYAGTWDEYVEMVMAAKSHFNSLEK